MFAKILAPSATALMFIVMVTGPQAQDAMAPDSMMSDGMGAMMSDEDLALCVEQAKGITFPEVAAVAEMACHSLQSGRDAMGGGAMMGGDTMSPKP